jgi:hypothetical protein
VRGAQDQIALARQVAIGQQRQRHGRVRATVFITPNLASGPHHEPGKQGLAGPEAEATRAWIGELGETAEGHAGRRTSGIHVQGMVTRHGRMSIDANTPART